MVQTVTLTIIAMIMYPTNWMTEETYKADHQISLGEIAKIRGVIGLGSGGREHLISQQI